MASPFALYRRVYNDYLLPSRLPVFRDLLITFQDAGYLITSVKDAAVSRTASSDREARLLIIRVDVDTDVKTARALWDALKSLNVNGAFYFRLCTIDAALMKEMALAGDEVGYHYEELSTLGKQRGCTDAMNLRSLIPEAQSYFARNLTDLRERIGLQFETVAAHGDWLNRKLGVSNVELLHDHSFRNSVAIKLEAYDPIVSNGYTKIIDQGPPNYWRPEPPQEALCRHDRFIYLTIHPRQWYARFRVNTAENLRRAFEEMSYRFRVLSRRFPGPERCI